MSKPDVLVRRMRSRREKLGITQAELATAIGTTQAAISEIETGATSPRVETLRRIADALQCDLDLAPWPKT